MISESVNALGHSGQQSVLLYRSVPEHSPIAYVEYATCLSVVIMSNKIAVRSRYVSMVISNSFFR
jgi:hypothetical protein